MGLDNAPCGPLALVLVALVLSERCAKHPVRTRLQHVNPGSAIPGSGPSSLPSNGATSVFRSIQLQLNAVQMARKHVPQDRHGQREPDDLEFVLVLFNTGACGFAHRALTDDPQRSMRPVR